MSKPKNDNREFEHYQKYQIIKLLMFIFCVCFWYHIANRKNDADGSSLNPTNAARQLGVVDGAETANNEHGEECGYAMLNRRTMTVNPMNVSKYYLQG